MRRFLALMGIALLLTGCTATTESTEVGVRVDNLPLFTSRGVLEEEYLPGGTYFFVRAFTDFFVFDTAIQNLVMVREHEEGGRRGDDSLRFKTIDGNDVSVNVTVSWRIDPDKGDYLVQFVGETTKEIEEKLVRPVTRATVRDILNQLTSEEYYQAQKRFVMSEQAKDRLNILLNREGVVIEQILLGEHKFNDVYEQNIRDKKVAEQEAERLVSETQAAVEEKKRDLERAKGSVQKAIEEARGEALKRQLEADAIYFERQKQAEAIVAEKAAKAKGLTERANALAGSGGEKMVKLAIAKALQGKDIIFMPAGGGVDVRSTDVNALLQTYGIQSIQK